MYGPEPKGTSMPRALRAAVAVGTLLAGPAAVPASAVDTASATSARASTGYCRDGNGVTVVIDFRELGGGTLVRCARGSHDTGLAALKAAGIDVTGTNRWGESFVCRLQGKPGPRSEPCVDTPPASAYWSYWHSPNGGRWTYSQRGVTYRTPPRGSFEGWSFSLDHSESDAPPPRIAPRRPSAGSSGGSGGSGPGAGQGANGGSAEGSGGSGVPGGTGGTGAPGAANGRTPGTTTGPQDDRTAKKAEREEKKAREEREKREKKAKKRTEAADGSREPAVTPTEAEEWKGGRDTEEQASGSSVPVGTLAGGGAAAALAAAGGFIAWRRRRARNQNATTP